MPLEALGGDWFHCDCCGKSFSGTLDESQDWVFDLRSQRERLRSAPHKR